MHIKDRLRNKANLMFKNEEVKDKTNAEKILSTQMINSKEKFEIYEANKELFSVILDENTKIYTF